MPCPGVGAPHRQMWHIRCPGGWFGRRRLTLSVANDPSPMTVEARTPMPTSHGGRQQRPLAPAAVMWTSTTDGCRALQQPPSPASAEPVGPAHRFNAPCTAALKHAHRWHHRHQNQADKDAEDHCQCEAPMF
jgi:hypothetical protein